MQKGLRLKKDFKSILVTKEHHRSLGIFTFFFQDLRDAFK
jgi:hypothetical protein